MQCNVSLCVCVNHYMYLTAKTAPEALHNLVRDVLACSSELITRNAVGAHTNYHRV